VEYIHINNLEEYHPGYKDRDLKWAKIHFRLVQGNPEFEVIHSEIDKWRFVAMICLELEARKPLPNLDRYWASKGFDVKKRSMSLTLQAIQNFITIDTQLLEKCVLEESRSRVDKIRVRVDSGVVEPYLKLWNEKMPWKLNGITSLRHKHLNERLKEPAFVDNFPTILDKILASDFLTGRKPSDTHPNFKADFDWLIANDTNHVKVMEGKYDNKEKTGLSKFEVRK
jgi:hypothetical protein